MNPAIVAAPKHAISCHSTVQQKQHPWTLEMWQNAALGHIAWRTEDEKKVALAIGRRCFESYERGVPTAIWHECAMYAREQGRDVSCYCAVCNPSAGVFR